MSEFTSKEKPDRASSRADGIDAEEAVLAGSNQQDEALISMKAALDISQATTWSIPTARTGSPPSSAQCSSGGSCCGPDATLHHTLAPEDGTPRTSGTVKSWPCRCISPGGADSEAESQSTEVARSDASSVLATHAPALAPARPQAPRASPEASRRRRRLASAAATPLRSCSAHVAADNGGRRADLPHVPGGAYSLDSKRCPTRSGPLSRGAGGESSQGEFLQAGGSAGGSSVDQPMQRELRPERLFSQPQAAAPLQPVRTPRPAQSEKRQDGDASQRVASSSRGAGSVLTGSADWLNSFRPSAAPASSASPAVTSACAPPSSCGIDASDATSAKVARTKPRSAAARAHDLMSCVPTRRSGRGGRPVRLLRPSRSTGESYGIDALDESAGSDADERSVCSAPGTIAVGPAELWERVQKLQDELAATQAQLALQRTRSSGASLLGAPDCPIELAARLRAADQAAASLRAELAQERKENERLSFVLAMFARHVDSSAEDSGGADDAASPRPVTSDLPTSAEGWNELANALLSSADSKSGELGATPCSDRRRDALRDETSAARSVGLTSGDASTDGGEPCFSAELPDASVELLQRDWDGGVHASPAAAAALTRYDGPRTTVAPETATATPTDAQELTAALEQARREVAALRQRLLEAEDARAAAVADLTDLEAEAAESDARAKRAVKMFAGAADGVTDLSDALLTTRQQMWRAEAAAARDRAALDEVTAVAEGLGARLATAQSESRSARAATEALKGEFAELQNQLQESRDDVKILNAALATVDDKLHEVLDELDEKNQLLEAAEQVRARHDVEAAALRFTLDQLRDEVAEVAASFNAAALALEHEQLLRQRDLCQLAELQGCVQTLRADVTAALNRPPPSPEPAPKRRRPTPATPPQGALNQGVHTPQSAPEPSPGGQVMQRCLRAGERESAGSRQACLGPDAVTRESPRRLSRAGSARVALDFSTSAAAERADVGPAARAHLAAAVCVRLMAVEAGDGVPAAVRVVMTTQLAVPEVESAESEFCEATAPPRVGGHALEAETSMPDSPCATALAFSFPYVARTTDQSSPSRAAAAAQPQQQHHTSPRSSLSPLRTTRAAVAPRDVQLTPSLLSGGTTSAATRGRLLAAGFGSAESIASVNAALSDLAASAERPAAPAVWPPLSPSCLEPNELAAQLVFAEAEVGQLNALLLAANREVTSMRRELDAARSDLQGAKQQLEQERASSGRGGALEDELDATRQLLEMQTEAAAQYRRELSAAQAELVRLRASSATSAPRANVQREPPAATPTCRKSSASGVATASPMSSPTQCMADPAHDAHGPLWWFAQTRSPTSPTANTLPLSPLRVELQTGGGARRCVGAGSSNAAAESHSLAELSTDVDVENAPPPNVCVTPSGRKGGAGGKGAASPGMHAGGQRVEGHDVAVAERAVVKALRALQPGAPSDVPTLCGDVAVAESPRALVDLPPTGLESATAAASRLRGDFDDPERSHAVGSGPYGRRTSQTSLESDDADFDVSWLRRVWGF